VAEAAAALLAWGQQLLQQQQGSGGAEQPTVCFAVVPLLIPAVVLMARSLRRQVRRFAQRPA
jgi:hypothetical protein